MSTIAAIQACLGGFPFVPPPHAVIARGLEDMGIR